MAITDNTAQWRVKKITNVTNNFDGYWQAGEVVEVGTLRFPRGQENTGYILECVEAGTTGTTQPEIITLTNEVANYAEVGRVGQVRVIFNLAEKDVDEVMAMGITYSRLTYPELWNWAGQRAGLIISEEEWQAKFAETNGKFVPYYSSGDGSSTFRTPLLCAYLKGAEVAEDVGKWMDAGLPNITGTTTGNRLGMGGNEFGADNTGALYGSTAAFHSGWYAAGIDTAMLESCVFSVNIDASLSNPTYGNSNTVTPETMTGVWVIKAVGVVVDSGETDIAQVLTATEDIQERVSAVEDWTNDSSNFSSMPSDNLIDIAIPTSSTHWTPPVDGWLCSHFEVTNMSTGAWFQIGRSINKNNSTYYLLNRINSPSNAYYGGYYIMHPVSGGKEYVIQFGNVTIKQLFFVYAQSEV